MQLLLIKASHYSLLVRSTGYTRRLTGLEAWICHGLVPYLPQFSQLYLLFPLVNCSYFSVSSYGGS